MVRSFEDRPVDRAMVDRLLGNARRAPSAGYSQPWSFLVFDGRAEVKRFWDVVNPKREGGWPDLFNAPLLIVTLSEKDKALDRYALPDKGWTDKSESHWPVPFWDIDTAMGAMLILLTAVDLGLGALFFGIQRMSEFKEAFGIPERVGPIGAIAIGHPKAGDRPSPSIKTVGRRPAEQLVHWGAFGRHDRPEVS